MSEKEGNELVEMGEEMSEHAQDSRRKIVGVTTAALAALLAVVTMMGHRLHTEEVVAQTKSADGWAYYQAKNSRSHMYGADAKLAELIGAQGGAVAAEWQRKAAEERHDADEIRRENEELDRETHAIARRATFFDASEVCLEVGIVLCAITLMTGRAAYWLTSFIAASAGLIIAGIGFLRP